MKKVLFVGAASLFASMAHADQAAKMSQLGFMTGCWQNVTSETLYEERFTKPTNNAMFGVAQFVKGGTTEFYEFLPIVYKDGKIVYTPYINGNKSVGFTLTSITKKSVTFENPKHDFPQKIVYSLTSGTLTARIEGEQNGQPANEDFVMQRTTCNE